MPARTARWEEADPVIPNSLIPDSASSRTVTAQSLRSPEAGAEVFFRWASRYASGGSTFDNFPAEWWETLLRNGLATMVELAAGLKSLPPAVRENYLQKWTYVQEHFVDRPDVAVADADRLVTALMAERGYPTGGYDQQVADLSVEHAAGFAERKQYLEGRWRHGGEVATEDLRVARQHYRGFLDQLLST